MYIQTINPTTNIVIKSFAEMTETQVNKGMEKASSDIESGKRVADQILIGMAFINHPTMTVADLPFGCIKRSSNGIQLSTLSKDEYANKKLIQVIKLSNPL